MSTMKRIIRIILTVTVVFLMSGMAVSAETSIPDMRGVWKATVVEMDGGGMEYDLNVSPVRTVTIESQNGRIFEGTKEYLWTLGPKPRMIKEGLTGIISSDGKQVYINDFSDGFSLGEMVSPDKFTVYYIQERDVTGQKYPLVAVADYVREKQKG